MSKKPQFNIGIFDKLKNDGEILNDKEKDYLLLQIDTPKNREGYYVDAFDSNISFKGIKLLKSSNTVMSITEYQQQEIRAIKESFYYFRENYCKIITKNGIGRPQPRNYQKRLEDTLITGEDTLAFFPRQSGKTVTIAIYLLWRALTSENKNIGISANVLSLASEVLDKIKKIYIHLPIWMQSGIVSWNKRSIELENGCKIMTAASNSDAFRGYTLDLLYCDETAFIRNNLFQEFQDAVMPSLTALQNSQAIFSSTANGLNAWYQMVLGARKNQDEKGKGSNGK